MYDYDTEKTNIDPVEPRAASSSPFRVVIMQQGGSLRELWLPEIAEGRYSFDGFCPVVIKAQNGKWAAVCEEGAYFQLQGMNARQVEIRHEALIEIDWQDKDFYLYSEAEKAGDFILYPYFLRLREKSGSATHRRMISAVPAA